MNEKSKNGSQLEMRWHSIIVPDQPKGRSSQPGMKWISRARNGALEDRIRLYLLSFLLTADRAKAEQCAVTGLDLSAKDSTAFQGWAHSWARRSVTNNALRLIAPHP